MTHLTGSSVEARQLDESTGDLGFFFDSTPQPQSNYANPTSLQIGSTTSPIEMHESDTKTSSRYQKKKRKIIQDESIHIDSEDDNDDALSISSSEDVSMLDALAHWGSSAMFQEEPAGHRYHSDDEEDYAILKNTPLCDIFDSDQDVITTLDSDEEQAPSDMFKWELDDHLDVPEHMRHNYRGLLKEERGQLKKQKKPKYKVTNIRAAKAKSAKAKPKKKDLIDRIVDEFVGKNNVNAYLLTDLTHLGRNIVVPKLAKLFKLEIVQERSNETTVELRKTSMTAAHNDLKKLRKRVKGVQTRRVEKRAARVQIKEDANHGKQVASSSAPISSSNVGHRMLAAMGWKEGEAIGNNENGIKEPVKVYLRAKRRGLGA
ncbi:hypothetical protein PS15p_201725 [Mucor circinelloides]